MRYAHGIVTGAVIPLIIFFVAAVIKAMGVGVVDPLILDMLWNVYVIWFFISLGIAIFPSIVVFAARRDMFREFIIYEAGGFGFFSPIYLILFTDLAGESWTTLFTEGITDGLIAPGITGIVGIDISSTFLIPFLFLSFILGIIFLRPSFIQKYGVRELTELSALKSDVPPSAPAPTEKDPIEAEMPDVAPPKASDATVADLRTLLTELGTPEPTINQILNSGISTTTDLVATSPDQLVTLTGLDKRTIEQIHMAVQKKVWFEGI
ncbi:MAG: helix-hairpin-helix domain-containing protein [Candidatus Thorarchaeota archaeon]